MANWEMLDELPFNLLPFPQNHNKWCSPLLPLNKTEFVIANGDGIYKYNITHNKWIKIMGYTMTHHPSLGAAVAMDQSNQLIFMYTHENKLLQFDLNTKFIQILSEHICSKGFVVAMACVNGVIHAIDTQNKHFIFDKNQKQFQEIHHFAFHTCGYTLLYLKSQKSFIEFDTTNCEMHQFRTLNNERLEWNQYAIKPMKAEHAVNDENKILTIVLTACTICGDYIFAFGFILGSLTILYTKHYLFMYNVKRKCFVQSMIKCPFKGICGAIIMRDEYIDNVIVFGFVNQCFADPEFVNMQKLPDYLIRFIGRWISNEWLYIINHASRQHCKIHVDQIMQSIKLPVLFCNVNKYSSV